MGLINRAGGKMPSKNRIRGNALEKEVVKDFKDYSPKRAWGSDGRALGLSANVDVYVEDLGLKVQCKRKKKLPDWVSLTDDLDCAILREDRGERYIIMKVSKFLDMIGDNK